MDTMRRYIYSIVRCVPDPQTGEFVNIGAIAGDPETGDWSMRQVGNESRARKLASAAQLDAVHRFLNEAGTQIDAMRVQAEESGVIAPPPTGGTWLEQLYYDLRNVVQLSEPLPIAASDAEQALDSIFGRQIIDPQSQARERAVTKMRVTSDLRNAYRRARLSDQFIETRPELYVGAHVRTVLDFAVVAGRTLQITQGWSFGLNQVEDVPVQVKAWGYAIEQLRRGDGARLLTARGSVSAITPDVDVQVVVVQPKTGEQRNAYDEADQVFKQLRVAVHELDDVDAVGTRAAELVSGTGHR
jgi:hypothetical protein